jgi:hypothetical protein
MPNFSSPSRFRVLLIATFTLLTTAAFAQRYQRTNLVADSNKVSAAATVDPNLVNAWGLSRGSGSPFWVADNGTGLATLYDSTGSIVPLVVTIPAPAGANGPSAPTGTVFNFTARFNVTAGQPAIFLFATEDGTIAPEKSKSMTALSPASPTSALLTLICPLTSFRSASRMSAVTLSSRLPIAYPVRKTKTTEPASVMWMSSTTKASSSCACSTAPS